MRLHESRNCAQDFPSQVHSTSVQRGKSRTAVSAQGDKAGEKREKGGVSVRAYIINVIRISNMMSLFKFNGMLFNED